MYLDEIAYAMSQNPGEFWPFLIALYARADSDFINEVTEYVYAEKRQEVVSFLRELADRMESAK